MWLSNVSVADCADVLDTGKSFAGHRGGYIVGPNTLAASLGFEPSQVVRCRTYCFAVGPSVFDALGMWRIARSSTRPVLEHGPRSLICARHDSNHTNDWTVRSNWLLRGVIHNLLRTEALKPHCVLIRQAVSLQLICILPLHVWAVNCVLIVLIWALSPHCILTLPKWALKENCVSSLLNGL